jgi:hypothetical protein
MSNRLLVAIYLIALIITLAWLTTIMDMKEAMLLTAISGIICLPILIIARNFAEAVVEMFGYKE